MVWPPATAIAAGGGSAPPKHHEISLLKPLPDIALKPVSLAERISGAVYSFANSYDWGNCTFGVASWIAVPDNLGNANTWVNQAMLDGFEVSNIPKIGAVAQTSAGYWGHVALVEDIKGNQVYVKEENVQGLGIVDEAWYPISDWTYIYF